MSKERKALINKLQTYIEYALLANLDEIITDKKTIEEILKVLEVKDKKIENLRVDNENLIRKLKNRLERINNKNNDIEKYKKLYKKLLQEIERKDKMIDLMSEYIVSCDSEEGICLKVEDNCYDYAGQNGKTCDTCIKQYFERKAEESSSINKTQEKN